MINNRKLLILVGVTAAMLAITVLLYSRKPVPNMGFVPGAALIQGLAPENIHTIEVVKEKNQTTLVREADAFQVRERFNYPANLVRVNQLLLDCINIKCDALVTRDSNNHEALGVTEEDKDAIVVRFKNADGNMIVGLIIGKKVEDRPGQYVRLIGQDAVYVTYYQLNVVTAPLDYINKRLIAVSPDDIEQVEIKAGSNPIVISRDAEGRYQLNNLPEGKRPKESAVNDSFSVLQQLDLLDVKPADQFKSAWSSTYACSLRSGLEYIIRLTQEASGRYYCKVETKAPEQVVLTLGETDEELRQKEAQQLAIDAAVRFNELHSAWVYEAPTIPSERMRHRLDQLIEDIPAEEPEEVSLLRILISYKDAENSRNNRTREEARELANKLATQARKNLDNFSVSIEEYTDEENKTGVLENVKKGVLPLLLQEAAFRLKVNEVSEPVELPDGFHVIMRYQ